MYFLRKLFGKKKLDVDVPYFLKNVEKNGGKGIAQVPIENFSDYLKNNGEKVQSRTGIMEGILNIDSKKFKVLFLYGKSQSLRKGETLVRISEVLDIEKDADDIGLEPLADKSSSTIEEFISNENDAYSVAWAIYTQSNMAYNCAYMAEGEPKFPKSEQHPALLASFLNKVCPEGRLKEEYKNLSDDLNFFEINDVFNSLTRDISDPEKKLMVNYAIAENIIKKWNLDR